MIFCDILKISKTLLDIFIKILTFHKIFFVFDLNSYSFRDTLILASAHLGSCAGWRTMAENITQSAHNADKITFHLFSDCGCC